MAWTRVASGDLVRADDINDIQKALDGTVGKAQIMSFTQVDDAASYALNVQNKDSTNSRIARFLNSAGTVVLGIVKEAVNVSKQIVSTVATGTAPFSVASTTLVSNLNADLLDGNHASAFALSGTGVTGGNSHDHVGGDGAAIGPGGLATGAVTAGTIANGAVDATARLANDIVDDTKVGNRVPAIPWRYGGGASWPTAGTTGYQVSNVRMQCGVTTVTISAGQQDGTQAITLTAPFGATPIVLASLQSTNGAEDLVMWSAYAGSAGSVTLQAYRAGTTGEATVTMAWLAIGPE